jgi:hypothetical protein
MDGSYRIGEPTVPPRDGGRRARWLRIWDRIPTVRLRGLVGRGATAARLLRSATTGAGSGRDAPAPWLSAHLQFLGFAAAREEPQEPTQAQLVLNAFEALDKDQQALAARNLALLWDCFRAEFDGVSGFCHAAATEQAAYLGKLEAAASRMQVNRAPEARYHFVSVALMWHYVSCFQTRTREPSAIELSRRVAALIDMSRAEAVTPA